MPLSGAAEGSPTATSGTSTYPVLIFMCFAWYADHTI